MKKNFKYLYVVLLGFLIVSCNKLDLNENPKQPTNVGTKLRLPAIEANLAYSLYSQARFAAYHSYYFTMRTGNNDAITDTWNYNGILRQASWRFHYFDVGANVNDMLKKAMEEKSNNYAGVGKIILAYSYLTTTDVFGDLPFSEAFTDSFNPKYDSQEQVLQGIEKLLDEGIADLNNVSELASTMNDKSDLIYKGDLNKWKSFALATKARLKLRTANFKGGYQELLTIVNDALAGFSDAIFMYPLDSKVTWERNLWGPARSQPEWNFAVITNKLNETLPTDVFMKSLTVDAANNIYDPRLYKLTTPGDNNKYLGAKLTEGLKDASLPNKTDQKDFANLYGGLWTKDDSPFPILLKEELYFIKAEAQFYLEDYDGALKSYQEGISLNMKRLEIPDGQIINFLGSSKVAQDGGSLKISHIMMQKYVALYLQPETWSDIRRYGYSTTAYPDFYYPKYALNEWQGRYIQRFPYDPETEYVYNPKEIARLGATARNWCFTPVWWAEMSTLKN
ncbi:SusD/RagB family nutrient-binding outer membrane lipoprotein [Pseudopedobacter beijingensis]|uniref:SusD/RagB family nutrient-binding outer membrane lipoprotein n=1 Tax=Pseudopedobacter beijingensis TaxID=1207056 RepID=A0ABW4IEE4_9SPHI